MKITDISLQARNNNRVNVFIDGKYDFSLDVAQVVDCGVKVGRMLTEAELTELRREGEFGKLYARALEYTLMRPHSAREIRDYLQRKTLPRKYKQRKTGTLIEKPGASPAVAQRVFARLEERGHIDDGAFAQWWVENRHQSKGASRRKLEAELRAKGVAPEVIHQALAQSKRADENELAKVIAKKRPRYPDEQKLIAYLLRQGFAYDDIRAALASDEY